MSNIDHYLLPGWCCECLCSDTATLHISQPSGSGCESRATEHIADQPDAN